MKKISALALSLLSAQLLYSQDQRSESIPAVKGRFHELDARLAMTAKYFSQFDAYLQAATTLQNDYAKKSREFAAEFKTIPNNFQLFLNRKKNRLQKLRVLCVEKSSEIGELLKESSEELQGIEPKSLPGILPRYKKIQAYQNKLVNSVKMIPG